MKKIVFIIVMLVCGFIPTYAQDTIVLNIVDHPGWQTLCYDDQQVVVVYAETDCDGFFWDINGFEYWNVNPMVINPQVGNIDVMYRGCSLDHGFGVSYVESRVPTEFTHTTFNHYGELDSLVAVGYDSIDYPYQFRWSTGETTRTINVTEPGTYTCDITHLCGTATRTFIRKNNVEIYRATVDLESKLNKVTWQVTPEQGEYISEVRVERDGMGVGSAPYEQGYFIDNIGSENAARNYRLIAITTEGTECPIPSYQKGTLHVDYSPNASNPNKINMAWTPPFIEEGAPIAVTYFQICKYDPATNEVTVVDQISANNTIGSYDVDLFDEGYAVVAAMFNEGKDYEDLAFSNLTEFLVGIEENESSSTGSGALTVYPNPAKDRVTIEGIGVLTIMNTLGQTIITKEIDGKTTIELPQGVYFVKLGETTRKVVVE